MKRTNTTITLPLVFALFFALVLCALASAGQSTRETPSPERETDLSTSPMKGPADAPVEIAVFTCFK